MKAQGTKLAITSGISTAIATIFLKLYSLEGVLLVLFFQAISTFTMFMALSKERASIVSPIAGTTANVLVVAFSILYLGEIISLNGFFGIFLVVLGTILMSKEED